MAILAAILMSCMGGWPARGAGNVQIDGGSCGVPMKISPSEAAKEWAFLKSFVPAYDRTWTTPSVLETADTVYAPVLGNGDMVGCMGGGNGFLTYYLRTADFWTDNGTGRWQVREIPAARLKIKCPKTTRNNSASYRQEEDILDAEVHSDIPVSGGVLRVLSYVAATQNTLVTRIINRGSTPVRIQAELSDDVLDRSDFPAQASVAGNVLCFTRQTNPRPGARWIARAGLALRVFGASRVEFATSDASHGHASFELRPGAAATLVTCMNGGKNAVAPLTKAEARVAKFNPHAVAALKTAHRAWWRNHWWLRSYVRTYDDTLDKYYYRSLYQLGTMCRAGNVNSGLHGPWTASDNRQNYCSYCLNDLGAAAYYIPLMMANRAGTAKMWIQTVYDWMPEGRRRAAAAGLPGILYPVHIAPWGTTWEDTYWGQKFLAANASLIGNWYVQLAGDKTCLKARVYPFMKACADFYQGWLRKEADGKYHVQGASYESPTDKHWNSCLDLALARILFTDIINFSKMLGVDAGRRAKWRDIRDHLNNFSTTTYHGRTVYQADAKTPFNGSRNVIQTQIIYPGYTCNRFSDARTRRIGHDTIEEAAAFGGWDQDNMVGQGLFMAAQRIGGFDVSRLIAHFKQMLVDDRYIRYPQYIAGISLWGFNQQLCVQAYKQGFMIFPGYPARRRAVFARIRLPGAFLASGEFMGGQPTKLRLYSEEGNPCTVIDPWGPRTAMAVFEPNGSQVSATCHGNRYTFRTEAGRTYRLEKK